MAQSVELTVTDHAEKQRYEGRLGSKVAGFIMYRLEPGRITLIHTEIDPALEGEGVGSLLVARTLEDIRARGLSVVPICPFVRAYIELHPQYSKLVSDFARKHAARGRAARATS